MTLERRYHVIAISLLVVGVAAGGVSWKLAGAPFWVVIGMALFLLILGLVFGGKAGAEERRRKEGLD